MFAAGRILVSLDEPDTISSVWERLRGQSGFETFDRYVLSLDLLRMLDLITLENGRLAKGLRP